MFAKKLLSIVSALFIGSQLVSMANAAGIPACSTAITGYDKATFEGLVECGGEKQNIASYCKIDGANDSFLIYGYDAATATCSTALDGVFAFNNNAGTVIDLGTTNIYTPTDITGNVAIYNCNGKECKMTSAIIRDSAANYIVAANGSASSASGIQDTTCNVGIIDTNDNILCLDGSIKASTLDKSYIMQNVSGNPFGTTGETSKFIVVKRVANIFAYDNLVKDDEYCVQSTSNIFTRTLEDFQTSDVASTCDKYYDCKSNLCSDVTTASTCTRNTTPPTCVPTVGANTSCNGYYIAVNESGSALKTDNSVGFLISCNATNCNLVNEKVGYFPNAGTNNVDYPFIKCKYSSVTSGKIVNSCSAIAKTDIDNVVECSEANIGGLINGNKLCVNAETSQAIELKDSNAANNGDYLINDTTLNVFVPNDNEAYHVLINVNDKEVELKAYDATGARYKYTVNNKVYEKAPANLGDSGICYGTNKDKIVEYKSDNCADDKMNFYTKQN